MSSFDQVPYNAQDPVPADIFADNPDPRCPVVLLLDKSGSMAGAPIEQLNEGLRVFQRECLNDGLAAKRVEAAIISFGPLTTDTDFVTMNSFNPPVLRPEGDTPIGRAGPACPTQADLPSEWHRLLPAVGVPYH